MLNIKRILVPVDFSEGSRAALREALALADAFDAQIDLLHIWEPSPYVSLTQPIWSGGIECVFSDYLQRQLEKRLSELVDEEAPAHRDRIHVKAQAGYVTHDIIAALETGGYDLVIMATHGRTGLSRVVLGSVAERVLRMSPCPALTVRVSGSDSQRSDKPIGRQGQGPGFTMPTHV